ncbi:MAG TPA: hypothetical protein VIC58_00495 [Actinomycetota bacterium]
MTKGTRPGRLPHASDTEEPGRICAHDGCATTLSVYNAAPFCWQHADVVFPTYRGKRLRKNRA